MGTNVIVKGFFGFPLLRITDMVVQRVFVREPTAETPGAGTSQVLHGPKYLNDLIALFRRWADLYDGKDHTLPFAKIMPALETIRESQCKITSISLLGKFSGSNASPALRANGRRIIPESTFRP